MDKELAEENKRLHILIRDLKDIPLGLYELMDRSHLIFETFINRVEEHKATIEDPELATLAKEVGKKLYDFYQLSASKFHNHSASKYLWKPVSKEDKNSE